MRKKTLNISLIVTVLNEADTIDLLLESIVSQTRLPNEVVVVDGGSTDETYKKLQNFSKHKSNKKISWKIFQQQTSISGGRNLAIKKAKHDWLAITDAGCILDKNWLKNLEQTAISTRQNRPTQPDIIAGYYKGKPASAFQEAVVPYVLVMPDRLDPKNFLPSTRSVLLKKKVWQELKGFDEKLLVSEDYAFFKKAKAEGFTFVTNERATIEWLPRKNLTQFTKMIYKMAKFDIKAGIIRPKVVLIFVRYFLGLVLLMISGGILLLPMILIYSWWAVQKNIKYAPNGWYWLPVLQITSDVAVMTGSMIQS